MCEYRKLNLDGKWIEVLLNCGSEPIEIQARGKSFLPEDAKGTVWMCGDVDPAAAIYGVMKTVAFHPIIIIGLAGGDGDVVFQSSPDRGDVGLSFGGCCHVGWDGVEPDTSALCPPSDTADSRWPRSSRAYWLQCSHNRLAHY